MTPTQIEKVTAHAAHLLDVYRGLSARYAVLEPLLFDENIIKRVGSGRRAHGLNITRGTIVESCVLEIAKILYDGDARSPNVSALTMTLDDAVLRSTLREKYAVWNIIPDEVEDPDVRALLEAAERRDEASRRIQFDGLVASLREKVGCLNEAPSTKSIRAIRDQLVAHNQLSWDGTAYKPLDVTALGLKLRDIGGTIDELEPIMDAITLIFRNSSFDFPKMRIQLVRDRDLFWAPAS